MWNESITLLYYDNRKQTHKVYKKNLNKRSLISLKESSQVEPTENYLWIQSFDELTVQGLSVLRK